MDDTPEPRWRRRKDARRPEIMAAAVELFTERGFAATRLEDVAKRAGVSKGTLYLYFANKEDLFKSLVRELLVVNLAELEELVHSHTGPSFEILERMLAVIGQRIIDTPAVMLPKLMIAEAANFPDLATFYVEEVVQRAMRIVAQVSARGIARGEFRPLPFETVGPLFISPILLAAIWKTTFAPAATIELDTAKILAGHLDTLRRVLLTDEGAGS